MIKVSGYWIGNNGDWYAGIQSEWYEIKGDFFFDDENHKREFETDLKNTFNIVCDPVFIRTFEAMEEAAKSFDSATI